MSYYDYEVSKLISAEDPPFYSLIMAAMRQADTDNLNKLAHARGPMCTTNCVSVTTLQADYWKVRGRD